MDEQAERQLLSIADVRAALGGISRTTVYHLIDEGLLARVNIGRRAFITSDSLDAYLEGLSV